MLCHNKHRSGLRLLIMRRLRQPAMRCAEHELRQGLGTRGHRVLQAPNFLLLLRHLR